MVPVITFAPVIMVAVKCFRTREVVAVKWGKMSIPHLTDMKRVANLLDTQQPNPPSVAEVEGVLRA